MRRTTEGAPAGHPISYSSFSEETTDGGCYCGAIAGARYLMFYFIVFAIALAFSLLEPTEGAQAQAACSVPNQITNGQVADATAVMGNFNALKSCADANANSAVTTSGTPATGSLSVFSAPKIVTNGDLSGDCTTAGTLAVTCTRSNGTPLGYFATGTDAGQLTGTISVNRFGNGANADSAHFLRGDGFWAVPPSGGGSTAPWDINVPAAASFLTASGDATQLGLTDDSDLGLILDCGTPVSGQIGRIAYKTLTDKTLAWTLTAKLKTFVPNTPNAGVGVYLMDSISGRLVSFDVQREVSNGTGVFYWSSLSAFNSSPFTMTPLRPIEWIRIVSDGTSLSFRISESGKQWVEVFNTSITGFLPNRPDRIGFGSNTNRTSGGKNLLTVNYFTLSGPAV